MIVKLYGAATSDSSPKPPAPRFITDDTFAARQT